MKKAIHITIILLFIAGMCLMEQLFSKSYLDELNKKVAQLQTVVAVSEDVDTEDISDLTYDIKNYWKDKETVLCTFVNHKEIEDIGVCINKLESSIRINDRDKFLENLNLIEFYIMSYRHVLGIDIQNIF
jgi:uncharacterized protein YxeA